MAPLDAAGRTSINRALALWRQGDCVVEAQWFAYRVAPDAPLTDGASAAATEGADTAEEEVFGFAVVTQTCDIVRDCGERHFVEVCPLVQVEEHTLPEIASGRRPSYALIPGIADLHLVCDLDRVMTVEKAVLAQWERTEGCRTDADRRRLALALARKRRRMAFPDDFNSLIAPLQRRLSSKHDKRSDEGRALRALHEIRVRAAPAWDAERIELMLWFIRSDDEPDFDGQNWHDYLHNWLARIPASGRFAEVYGQVVTLDDLTARDYVESDPLDLDHLSNRRE